MSPTLTSDRVNGDVDDTADRTTGDDHEPDDGRCALCSLRRSEHGVQFIHRFIHPDRAIVTL